MTSPLVCALCGVELSPPAEKHFIEIVGWEKPGRGANGRSGSSLVLRKPTGRIACVTCVTERQYGITPEQMTLA